MRPFFQQKIHQIFILFTILSCFAACIASEPSLAYATVQDKRISLLGRDFEYGIFEMEFNEEISIIDNMPCPCFHNDTGAQCSVPTLITSVNETGYNITTLQENISTPMSMGAGDNRIFKLSLQPNDANPCPILVIRLSIEQGPVAMFVSNRAIPAQGNSMWSKPYWGRDSIWLCPTLPWFGYGDYYINVVSQVGDATNRYSIMYYIKNAPRCPSGSESAPNGVPLPEPGTFTWLSNNVPKYGNISNGEYHYYRYRFEERCANFSAAVRRLQFAAADVDIYASASNPNPTQENYEWNANMDGDDSLVISYCAPSAPWDLYIGVTTYLNDSPYVIVATRTDTFELRSVETMGAATVAWNLARGADLHCGDDTYYCDFGGYEGCYGDGFRCCFPLYFLPPSQDPNPFWPRHSADPIIDSLGRLKYDPYPELLPRKISLALLRSHRTEGSDYVRFVDPSVDLTKCEMRWASLIVGSSSATPITTPTKFQRKANPCVTAAFDAVATKIDSYVTAMYEVESQDDLALLHVKLGFAGFSDSFVGCTDLVDSLATKTAIIFPYSNVTACEYLWGTTEYYNSPCCNQEKAFSQCCAPRQLSHQVLLPNADLVLTSSSSSGKCKTAECSKPVVKDYARLLNSNSDAQTGCSAVFRRTAGDDILRDRVAFIGNCRRELLGDDLLGSSCASGSDCRAGYVCQQHLGGRCNHSDDLVLECIAQSMDPATSTFLLQRWGIGSNTSSQQVLLNQLRLRYLMPTCVGGNAVRHRNHYWYTTDSPFCEDECKISDLEPRCLDTDCEIPPVCNRATGAACWRIWTFNEKNEETCLADRRCSWIDCAGSFPGDPAACEAECVNTSVANTSVCVRCDNPFSCRTFSPISTFDLSRCNQGLCSADPAETDPTACASKGVCSVQCIDSSGARASCNNSTSCTASEACSDSVVAQAMLDLGINTTGVCVLHFSSMENSCEDTTHIQVPSGCASSAFTDPTSCVASGGYWHIPASDAASCIASAGYGCFNVENGKFLNRSQAECTRCRSSDSEWRPFYSWSNGVWEPGRIMDLLWVQREWIQTNNISMAIDYPALRTDVEAAIAEDLSVAFLTNALCEFDNVVKTVKTIACDCDSGSRNPASSSCFSDTSNTRQIGVTRFCPGIENSFNVIPVILSSTEESLPRDAAGCVLVGISLTPADQFALPGTSQLTSEIFKQRISTPYAVVRNKIDGVVGQILSDAVEIKFDYGQLPFRLCIRPLSSIVQEDEYSRLDFARINTGQITMLEASVSAELSSDGKNYFCAEVSQNGTYFAVATRPDYSSVTPFDGSQRAQSFVGAALYYFVFSFGLCQGFIILKWDNRSMLQRLGLLAIVAAFNLIRGAFFSLNAGALDSQPAARYIFFELPTFLFFSAYSVILFLWTQVIRRSKILTRKSDQIRWERILLGALNVVFYAVFILFIILFSTLGTERSPCSFSAAQNQARLSANQRSLGIAYQAVIAVICLSMAVIFCIQGGRLILMFRGLLSHESASRRRTRLLLTTTAAICTISFVIRSFVFIVASSGTSIPAIVFVLLEVAPSVTVLWMIKPWNSVPDSQKSASMSLKTSTAAPSTIRHKNILSQVSTTNSSSVRASVTASSSPDD